MSDTITLRLPHAEGSYLHELVQEFLEVIDEAASQGDGAVARLTPDVYPDDAEASAAFREATRGDLQSRRRHAAQTVLASLRSFTEESIPGRQQSPGELRLTPRDVDAWMRTLSAIRLIMADRLGIADEDTHDPDDLRFGVYDWVGYRLDQIVMLADARDATHES